MAFPALAVVGALLKRVRAWKYIVALLGVLSAVGTFWYQSYRSGQNAVIAETAKRDAENTEKANEIERGVATAKPDVVRDRLRKYQRD